MLQQWMEHTQPESAHHLQALVAALALPRGLPATLHTAPAAEHLDHITLLLRAGAAEGQGGMGCGGSTWRQS